MSFTNYLSEQQGSRISELKFLELLNEKARSSHDMVKKNPIYKVMKGREDYMLYDPKKTPDKSGYWIDRLTSELPGWKKYPSRVECLRCYSSYDRAGDQENSFVVIPLDRTRIGISSKSSFYKSFGDVAKSMQIEKLDNEGLTTWVTDLASTISKLSNEKIDMTELTTHKSLKLALSKIDRILRTDKLKIAKALKSEELDISTESQRRIEDVIARHVTTLDLYLQEKLDPENNGFHAINIESLREYHDREIWIDSPCLLVRRSAYVELHKRGEIK